jgi:membrane protease YdiL (CAAX protease family)
VIGFWPIVVTYLLVRAFWLLLDQSGRALDSILAPGLLKIALWVVPCLAIAMAVNRQGPRAALREFGLVQGLRGGVAFGVLATLPLAAAVLFVGVQGPGIAELVAVSVLDPIGESVLFSGFLFSQLRRWRWRVVPALVASGLMFGLAHLGEAEFVLAGYMYRAAAGLDLDGLWMNLQWIVPGVVAVAAGGCLFTWLFHRWASLWPTIALHSAINFWWTLSADRAGFIQSIWDTVSVTGVAHGLSMAIAVGATLMLTRRPTT